jgi:dipeptidyl-peptidase 4
LNCLFVRTSSALAALLLVSVVLPAQEKAKPLTVEGIFAQGEVMGEPPEGLTWSPDGQLLTYLDGGELIDIHPGLGKPRVLIGRAKLASLVGGKVTEQDRDHRTRYGMASYLWAPDSKHLMFDSNGSLWIYDLANGTGVDIGYAGEGSGDDPKFSPNGEFVSFIRNHVGGGPLAPGGNANRDGRGGAESSDAQWPG